jgi:hypothetical protein
VLRHVATEHGDALKAMGHNAVIAALLLRNEQKADLPRAEPPPPPPGALSASGAVVRKDDFGDDDVGGRGWSF